VPTRDGPVLAATDSATGPLPFPDWPESTVVHDTVLAADHAHPAIVETLTVSRPPAAEMLSCVLLRLNTQGAGPWFTATRSDPTVTDAVRGEGAGLGATVYGTTASPCPVRMPEKDTHAESAATDHEQSREVETVSDPEPPFGPNDEALLLTLIAHLVPVGAVTEVELERHAAAAIVRAQTARRSATAAQVPGRRIRITAAT